MGRYSPSKSTGHKIRNLGQGSFRLEWVVDRYYPGSRLRHPTGYTRDTDFDGAKRFAERWGLQNWLNENA